MSFCVSHIAGVLIIIALFAMMFMMCAKDLGWRGALRVYGLVVVLMGVILLAVWLMTRPC